ncbi:MAG: histidine phosphatase family protein [Acidobacteria bacterium]|nr:histidine phosphatase family protein [Acidobacteriota bacterium]
MNVYLLRHASAGTRRTNPKLDDKRSLDKDGKRHCLLLGHVLSNMKIQFDAVISSPLKRAVQTASLVGNETGFEQKIVFSSAMLPDAGYAGFERLINEHAGCEDILVVGHEPNISTFVGKLAAGGGKNARPAHIRMRKGSIAKFSLERGRTELQWLIEPRSLRALYASSTKSSRRKTSRK